MALTQRFIVALPRLWLDIIALLLLLLIVLVMFYQNRSLTSLIPTLGLFLGAAFRILPSFNRIMNSFQGFKFSMPGVKKVYFELKTGKQDFIKKPKTSEKILLKKELNLINVSFKYEKSNKKIITNLNLKIPIKKTIGIIGQSGSGKSTLVDIILGLLKPTDGIVSIDNLDIHKNLESWQSQVGYVPQDIYLIDDTLLKNIAFGIDENLIDIDRVTMVINYANLSNFVNSLENGVFSHVGEKGVKISGGQKQRVGIARALYNNPTLLVLDEATSALDKENEKLIMDDIYRLSHKMTTIIISHNESTLLRCDKIYKINEDGVLEAKK